MVGVMKGGLIPAPKGRVRNPVGHKYLEALQAKAYGKTPEREVLRAEQKDTALDLLVLGVTSGTAMDSIDFALCKFNQESPEAPLHLDVIQVRPLLSSQSQP